MLIFKCFENNIIYEIQVNGKGEQKCVATVSGRKRVGNSRLKTLSVGCGRT